MAAIIPVNDYALYTILAIETACLVFLSIANWRLQRTVKKLERIIEKLKRSSYDAYLLQTEFRHIAQQILRIVVTKMKTHSLRNNLSFTSETYMRYKKLYVEEVIKHIKPGRLYQILVHDVFGSEEALKSYLEGYFELETVDIYLSEVHET